MSAWVIITISIRFIDEPTDRELDVIARFLEDITEVEVSHESWLALCVVGGLILMAVLMMVNRM